MIYFIIFLLATLIGAVPQRNLKKKYGTSIPLLLLKRIPKNSEARKRLIQELTLMYAIGCIALFFLALSLLAFWEELKTIGP